MDGVVPGGSYRHAKTDTLAFRERPIIDKGPAVALGIEAAIGGEGSSWQATFLCEIPGHIIRKVGGDGGDRAIAGGHHGYRRKAPGSGIVSEDQAHPVGRDLDRDLNFHHPLAVAATVLDVNQG